MIRKKKEQFFLDNEFAEQMEMFEDDLIEEFIDRELEESDWKDLVRNFFLRPERIKKLRLIQALKIRAKKEM